MALGNMIGFPGLSQTVSESGQVKTSVTVRVGSGQVGAEHS